VKAREVSAVRWVIVVFYAFLGMGVALGGVSSGELTLMVVAGVCAFVGIVLADWINAGVREREPLDHDDYWENPR
jgi:hypothetical protein